MRAFDAISLDALSRFELADAFADDGEWAQAAALLEGLYPIDRPTESLRRRLFYLYRADDRTAARTLFASLGPKVLEASDILRIGAAIYERSGMLKDALEVLDRAVKLDPADLRSRLDWVRIAIRAGDENSVAAWIKKAKSDFNGEPEDLIELAQLLDRYGRRKEALLIGYQTLSQNWAKSERVHMAYLSLFLLHSKKDKFLDLKRVAIDSVVSLENEFGQRARYLIEENTPPALEVLSPDHPFALIMLGKSMGDSVTLNGIGQPSTWKVVDLRHKYVDLFRQALDAHARLFPGSRALGMFHINFDGDKPFEPIFEQARERARLVGDAAKLYAESPIPVETIAKVLGSDPVDTSRGLRFNFNVWLDSCIGEHAEREAAITNLEGQSIYLVDSLTLSIWQEIGFLAVLEGLPVKVRVIQPTIDDLTVREHDARNALGQSGGSLEAKDEGIALIETTKEQREAYWQRNRELLLWVRAHAELVPTAALASLEQDLTELLSDTSIDTIATAVETGTALIIEDRRLRMLAAQFGAASSAWTQPLLMKLRADGILTEDAYVRLVVELWQQRIGFVSVGSSDFVIAHDLGQREFSSLASAISGTTVAPVSIVTVVSEFILRIWTERRYIDERERLIGEVFRSLFTRPDGIKIVTATAANVYKVLGNRDLPGYWAGRLWNRYFDEFLRGHFVRDLARRRV